MHLVHLIPYLLDHGALSQLTELRYAVSKYHPEVTQEVLCLTPGTPPENYPVPVSVIDQYDLEKYLQKKQNPVCLLHKVARTDANPVHAAVGLSAPLYVLTHTATKPELLPDCDGIITVSKQMYRSVSKSNPHENKIHHIQNAVNQERYVLAEEIPQQEHFFATGRINNLNKCKHPTDWIDFLSRVDINKPLWHDYLGGGTFHEQAHKQARMARSARNVVKVHGPVADFNLKVKYLHHWDAFLYEIPGSEGISMSILEALACGTPALINNKPGNTEIIFNGVNGYVCNTRLEFIYWMKKLAKNKSMREDLSASTLQHFKENLDARQMAKSYIGVLSQ